ncbi:MAG: MFS transporter [Clostridiaceae bacterium]|nr:MFS transporter [Eubacteriales bacterium]
MVSILLLCVIYLSFISLGLPDPLLGSAWPTISGSLGVPLSFAGVASIIAAGGTVVSSILSARLIRRFGTGKITAASVALTATALIAISFVKNFYVLSVLMIPLGLGGGCVDAALNNYIALHYKAKHMSWLHCFWGIGATLGPVIMSACLVASGSWQAGYRTVSYLQFGLVAVLIASLPLWNKVSSPLEKDDGAAPLEHKALGVLEVVRLKGAKFAMLTFFFYCAIEYTAGLWGSSYLAVVRGVAKETATQWVSLYYFGITAGRFLSGFLTLKFSNRRMIGLGYALIGLGILLILLPLPAAVLLPAFFLVGLGCAPVFPSMLHETPKNFGAENSQAVMGVQMASAYIGGTVMPPVFGFLATFLSNALFPYYLLGMLILMALATKVLNRRVDAARK